MSDALTVVWDDALKAYDFGPGHPLAPIRVQLAMRLATDFGLLTAPRVTVHTPVEPATLDDLLRVHDPAYIAAVVPLGEVTCWRSVAASAPGCAAIVAAPRTVWVTNWRAVSASRPRSWAAAIIDSMSKKT